MEAAQGEGHREKTSHPHHARVSELARMAPTGRKVSASLLGCLRPARLPDQRAAHLLPPQPQISTPPDEPPPGQRRAAVAPARIARVAAPHPVRARPTRHRLADHPDMPRATVHPGSTAQPSITAAVCAFPHTGEDYAAWRGALSAPGPLPNRRGGRSRLMRGAQAEERPVLAALGCRLCLKTVSFRCRIGCWVIAGASAKVPRAKDQSFPLLRILRCHQRCRVPCPTFGEPRFGVGRCGVAMCVWPVPGHSS